MGLFDEIYLTCPACKKEMEPIQTKATAVPYLNKFHFDENLIFTDTKDNQKWGTDPTDPSMCLADYQNVHLKCDHCDQLMVIRAIYSLELVPAVEKPEGE